MLKLKLPKQLLLLVLCIVMLGACYTVGEQHPVATLTFSNGESMRIRLYPEYAPNTVANFIDLCNSGYYDNSPVHRVEEYFVIQMGSAADGTSPGFTIKGEFPNNGYTKNTMSHEFATVSMARQVGPSGSEKEFYDTASTQFFVVTRNHTELDGDYAVFGKLMDEKSMETMMDVSRLDVDENKVPLDEFYIVSATVETYGKSYKVNRS